MGYNTLGRPTPVVLQEGAYTDAFGRLRVAESKSLLDSMSQYPSNPFFWETSFNGGSLTHRPNEGSSRLSTGGTTSGNYAIRQTKQYLRYQPGRSLNVELTFVMGAEVSNGTARIGYFDSQNGIFLERSGGTLNIVRRTFVSGEVVEERIPQSSWNVNKFSDTSQTGFNLDVKKTQILFIQLQFLGVGRVQVGFVVDGQSIVAHEFLNANNLSTVYMSTGCLPVRSEVINTALASGTLYMDVICASVSSGGLGSEKIRLSVSNGITARNTNTDLLPVISLRASQYFGGVGGAVTLVNRGQIEVQDMSVLVTGQIHEYRIILNGTLTNPSWQSVNVASSLADYDVASTAITGGTVVFSGYLPASANARAVSFSDISEVLPLVYSGFGINDSLSICVRTTTGTGTCLASFVWDEQY